jgi:hypothetical protein
MLGEFTVLIIRSRDLAWVVGQSENVLDGTVLVILGLRGC